MGIAFTRTLVLYIMLIIAMRVGGKRQVGELQPTELVVAILISELAAIPLQDVTNPLINGIIPILTIISLEVFFSGMSLMTRRLRNAVYGNSVTIIKNGIIDQKAMRILRMSLDDILEEMRQKDIDDITKVDTAIVETNGKLSLFLKPGEQKPTVNQLGIVVPHVSLPHSLIVDGVLYKANLDALGKSLDWVMNTIKNFGAKTIKDVFYMSLTDLGDVNVILKQKKNK